MDHKYWTVCASIKMPDGELIDKDKPFGDYNVEASTSNEAIELLKEDFPGCKIEIYGQPTCKTISEEEYNGE